MPNADGTTTLTSDYRRNRLARSVPYSFYASGEWRLPPDPDPDGARIALRLFPALMATEPELVARARLSGVDHRPIDLATAHWERHAPASDPWWRIDFGTITPHLFQRIDAFYAIDRLEKGYGAYLGWEVGLGKSLGACMVIDGWQASFVLIACPNNAKHDPWVQHLTRFCPWIKPLVVGNTPATRTAALDEAEARLSAGEPTALIVHYQALALIDKMGAKTVSGWRRFGQWDLFISDEAHLYKNRKAQFTRVARNIKTAGRLNLSGSVMSGRAEDLFVPLNMFQPKRYASQWRDFNDRFLESVEDDYGVRQIVGPKIHRLEEFRAELGEVLTVRLAKDWLDIPEPHVVTRLTPMHPEQRKAYRSMVDELLAEMPDGTINYTTDGAPLRSACRQITAGVPAGACPDCATHIEAWGNPCLIHQVRPATGLISSKHDAAMDDILSAGDSQCVYFAWHKRPVYELARRCEEAGIPCTVICGDVSQAERERRIDLFKRGGYRVLVATIATLSSAANLQCASVVGMLEESDDPVDNSQAVGRVVRQGQPVHASVYHYRVPDSVDTLSVQTNAASKAELRRLLLGS